MAGNAHWVKASKKRKRKPAAPAAAKAKAAKPVAVKGARRKREAQEDVGEEFADPPLDAKRVSEEPTRKARKLERGREVASRARGRRARGEQRARRGKDGPDVLSGSDDDSPAKIEEKEEDEDEEDEPVRRTRRPGRKPAAKENSLSAEDAEKDVVVVSSDDDQALAKGARQKKTVTPKGKTDEELALDEHLNAAQKLLERYKITPTKPGRTEEDFLKKEAQVAETKLEVARWKEKALLAKQEMKEKLDALERELRDAKEAKVSSPKEGRMQINNDKIWKVLTGSTWTRVEPSDEEEEELYEVVMEDQRGERRITFRLGFCKSGALSYQHKEMLVPPELRVQKYLREDIEFDREEAPLLFSKVHALIFGSTPQKGATAETPNSSARPR